jgi:hypothetical protein
MDEICRVLKTDEVASIERVLSDNTGAYTMSKSFKSAMQRMADKEGIQLNHEQLAAMQIPNSVQSLSCYAWMSAFFKLVGDSAPNRDEIHLESITVVEIYSEYKMFAESTFQIAANISVFSQLWRTCFTHVKIRAYKAVDGKCTSCASLSHSRKSLTDTQSREAITLLHAWHRSMYMGERMSYYARRHEALQYPSTVWSIIGDGMAQQHCQLPYLAGLKTIDTLPQHLQGVYAHGQLMKVYRTYHNVTNNSNMQIQSLLLTIEYLMLKNNGSLPEKLYYQIDGGSENTAKVMLGVAELLVARRIVGHLELTRLPVGHTHEDIDSKFAKIWVALRRQHVATMSAYSKLITEALQCDDSKLPVEVVDIFAVPDYAACFEPCMDKQLARYAKLAWTQLQWRFQQVEVSPDFPLGVKTTYRAYAQDVVNEIVEDRSKEIGYACHSCHVQWFPEAGPEGPAGMYLLSKFPTDNIKPENFIAGSRDELEKVLKRVSNHYTPRPNVLHNPLQHTLGVTPTLFGDEIVAEWVHFVENIAPLSDDVNEYCATHPLHIPLRDRLFNQLGPIVVPATVNAKIVQLTQTKTLDSVQWSRRGFRRNSNHISNKQSRALLVEVVGSDSSSSGSESDMEEDYNYAPLNRTQKSEFKSYLQFVGKHFVDSTEGEERIEGCVRALVMENTNKTVCFEYYENNNDEPQYIVADFAISECQWIEVKSSDNDNATKHTKTSARTARGWHYLDDDETVVTAAQLDLVQCVVVDANAPRQMRKRRIDKS